MLLTTETVETTETTNKKEALKISLQLPKRRGNEPTSGRIGN